VAGIIGAQGNNGLGIAGVAWNVSLMGLKIFGEGVSGGTLSMLIKSMQYAVDNKAHIINASFGNTAGSVFATKAFSEMLNLANENNIVFVAAAGNSSMDLEQKPHYPASFTHPNIITVAALEESGGLAVFSNWGIKSVDLAAPGQNIISTVVGGGTAYNSGTSMAAPFVAGSAAILLSMFPKLSVKEIKFVLMNSVTKLTRLEGKVISSGTLNLIKSIKLAKKVSYYKDSFQ
jgi:subtilisin family serine protease